MELARNLDSGWAWVVLAAGAVAVATCTSMNATFGLLFGQFLLDMNVNPNSMAVVLGLTSAVYSVGMFFSGPLSKILPVRGTCVVCALMMTLSLVAVSQATKLWHFAVSFSVVYALASGTLFGLSFLLVNQYFDKRRGLAMAIFFGGSSVGRMLLPLLVASLVPSLGIARSLLVIGAVWAVTIPAAWMHRPRIPAGAGAGGGGRIAAKDRDGMANASSKPSSCRLLSSEEEGILEATKRRRAVGDDANNGRGSSLDLSFVSDEGDGCRRGRTPSFLRNILLSTQNPSNHTLLPGSADDDDDDGGASNGGLKTTHNIRGGKCHLCTRCSIWHTGRPDIGFDNPAYLRSAADVDDENSDGRANSPSNSAGELHLSEPRICGDGRVESVQGKNPSFEGLDKTCPPSETAEMKNRQAVPACCGCSESSDLLIPSPSSKNQGPSIIPPMKLKKQFADPETRDKVGGIRKEREMISALKIPDPLRRILCLPRDVFRQLDFGLFRSPVAVLVVFSECCSWTAISHISYMTAVALRDRAFDENAIGTFLVVPPVLDLAARFTVPLMHDRQWVRPKVPYAAGLLLMAASAAGFPFSLDRPWAIITCCGLFGFGQGCAVSYFGLVAVHYCGLDRLASMRAFTGILPAAFILLFGVIIGTTKSVTASYDIGFLSIAVFTASPVLLWIIFEPRFAKSGLSVPASAAVKAVIETCQHQAKSSLCSEPGSVDQKAAVTSRIFVLK